MESISKNMEMVLLEKPLCLRIGQKRFKLYQPSLGKMLLQKGILEEIMSAETAGIENALLKTLAMVEQRRDAVCEYLALHSFRDSKDALDPYRTEERAGEFAELETSDLATLLTALMQLPNAGTIIEESGMGKENERKKLILDTKDTKGSMVCGGVTIWGSMLDHVMQRYGWSLQYALWGISAANLQLLSSDETVSVYLSDEELKKVPSTMRKSKDVIDANDPANASIIREKLRSNH